MNAIKITAENTVAIVTTNVYSILHTRSLIAQSKL